MNIAKKLVICIILQCGMVYYHSNVGYQNMKPIFFVKLGALAADPHLSGFLKFFCLQYQCLILHMYVLYVLPWDY